MKIENKITEFRITIQKIEYVPGDPDKRERQGVADTTYSFVDYEQDKPHKFDLTKILKQHSDELIETFIDAHH